MKKIKVFVVADSPLAPSGVAGQTRYMIEGLLKTGKFSFVCFGGAIKHPDYTPIQVDPYGEDWKIYPVDGYGNPDQVRSCLQVEKPDIMWIMTDPRFYVWLWSMENEIRSVVPLVYYHVWDNYPYPMFNKKYYMSNDFVATISKVTDNIVSYVAPEVERERVPHTVNTNIFKKQDKELVSDFLAQNGLAVDVDNRPFTFFWNNRNARRKQSGSVLWWFSEFLDRIGRDKARLIMHTEPKDPNGQDLAAIMDQLNLNNGEVLISVKKVSLEELSMLYNSCDCTINISDAEGFGLATLESLSCEVPIVVNMTGGLQEQVTDGEEWFGKGIHPSSKAIIGSQEVPYIYEDRISKEDFINALEEMYNMSKEEREELGKKGREHVLKNYGFDDYVNQWIDIMEGVHERHGSWETRKYKSWEFIKLS